MTTNPVSYDLARVWWTENLLDHVQPLKSSGTEIIEQRIQMLAVVLDLNVVEHSGAGFSRNTTLFGLQKPLLLVPSAFLLLSVGVSRADIGLTRI